MKILSTSLSLMSMFIVLLSSYITFGYQFVGGPITYCSSPLVRSKLSAPFGKQTDLIRAIVRVNAEFGFDFRLGYPALESFRAQLSSDESQLSIIYFPIESFLSITLYVTDCARDAPIGVRFYEELVAEFAVEIE